jgi:hypothetical protein
MPDNLLCYGAPFNAAPKHKKKCGKLLELDG